MSRVLKELGVLFLFVSLAFAYSALDVKGSVTGLVTDFTEAHPELAQGSFFVEVQEEKAAVPVTGMQVARKACESSEVNGVCRQNSFWFVSPCGGQELNGLCESFQTCCKKPATAQFCVKEGGLIERSGDSCCEGLVSKNRKCVKSEEVTRPVAIEPKGCVKEGAFLERIGERCCEGLESRNRQCLKPIQPTPGLSQVQPSAAAQSSVSAKTSCQDIGGVCAFTFTCGKKIPEGSCPNWFDTCCEKEKAETFCSDLTGGRCASQFECEDSGGKVYQGKVKECGFSEVCCVPKTKQEFCVKEGKFIERSGDSCCEGLVSKNRQCVKSSAAPAPARPREATPGLSQAQSSAAAQSSVSRYYKLCRTTFLVTNVPYYCGFECDKTATDYQVGVKGFESGFSTLAQCEVVKKRLERETGVPEVPEPCVKKGDSITEAGQSCCGSLEKRAEESGNVVCVEPAATTVSPATKTVSPATKPPAKPAPAPTRGTTFYGCTRYEGPLTQKIYCRQKCGPENGGDDVEGIFSDPYDTDIIRASGFDYLSDCQVALKKYKDELKPGTLFGAGGLIESVNFGFQTLTVDKNTVNEKTYDRTAIVIKFAEVKPAEPEKPTEPAKPAERTYCEELIGRCTNSAIDSCNPGTELTSPSYSSASQSCVSAGKGDTCCLKFEPRTLCSYEETDYAGDVWTVNYCSEASDCGTDTVVESDIPKANCEERMGREPKAPARAETPEETGGGTAGGFEGGEFVQASGGASDTCSCEWDPYYNDYVYQGCGEEFDGLSC